MADYEVEVTFWRNGHRIDEAFFGPGLAADVAGDAGRWMRNFADNEPEPELDEEQSDRG